MGLRLRVSTGSLPRTRPAMLPSSMNTPWAESNRYKDFGAQYHSQPDGHARSVHPRVLSVYASTQDFGGAPFATHLSALIPTLQHSILGVWLTLTQAGYPPACQQTISSPHVQRLVLAATREATLQRTGNVSHGFGAIIILTSSRCFRNRSNWHSHHHPLATAQMPAACRREFHARVLRNATVCHLSVER